MNILVQFPTLGRPDQFLECLSLFLSNLSGNHQVVFNINCDIDDLKMNNSKVKEQLAELFWQHHRDTNKIFKPVYDVHYDRHTTKISSMNAHIKSEFFDIIMGASDDMIPCEFGWDDTIAQDMEKYYPDLNGTLSYSDGRDVGELVTFSILGKELYNRFGYIYHPDYKTLYCDNEFTDVVNDLNLITYIDTVLFKHEHYAEEGNRNSGNLDFAARKTLQFSGRDGMIYKKRKEMGFPAEKITND